MLVRLGMATSLIVLVAAPVSGFTMHTMKRRIPFGTVGHDTRDAGVVSLYSADMKVPTEEVKNYFEEALDCAHSDACPIEEAETYFPRIQEIQQEKESLANICDEILIQLRYKLQAVQSSSNMRISDSGAAAARVYSPIDIVIDSVTVALIVAVLMWFYPIFAHNDKHYTTLYIREWTLAYKHGYMDDMISHYMRNGGI